MKTKMWWRAASFSMVVALLFAAFSPNAIAAQIPLSERPLHVLNRLAFGPRPGDLERVREIGVDEYIAEQLHPDSIAVPEHLANKIADLKTLHMTPLELMIEYGPEPEAMKQAALKNDPEAKKDLQMARRQRARIVMEDAVQGRFLRAVQDSRQLKEVMTDFWFNHFNIFAGKDLDTILTASFEEEAIRPHAMGRFRDLLEATAKHPAMLYYLDNWLNTAPNSPGARGKQDGLNENYARELMELHTLGVDGGYTQQDVIALARILTGWGVQRPRRAMAGAGQNMEMPAMGFGGLRPMAFGFGRRPHPMRRDARPEGSIGNSATTFFFDPRRHDFGDKEFLGHTIRGTGYEEVEQALDILARHPSTAHHLSFQLAQYFVADQPPKSLVDRLAARFAQTDGNITAVLETLFHSPEFWDNKYYEAKFKTPYQYVVSVVRATGIDLRNSRPLFGTLQQLGMPLYMCLTPDGYKNTQEAWLNSDSMMRRLNFATAVGSGRLRIDLPPPPDEPFRFKQPRRAMDRAMTPVRADNPGQPPPQPVNYLALAQTLGNRSSPQTAEAIKAAPEQLKAAIILGSPEFMKR
jgi:uncharacterized protein (DUF1800 family)